MYLQFIILLIPLYYSSVPLQCNDASTQESCLPVINAIYECTWAQNECQNANCEHLQKNNCEGAIYNWKPCSVVDGICQSIDECEQVQKKEVCPHIHPKGKQCIWNNGCSEQDCSYFNVENCTNINGITCLIVNDKCTSVTNCQQINNENQCNKVTIQGKECQWVNSSCDMFSCKRYQTDQACVISRIYHNTSCFNIGTQTDVICAECSDLDQIACENSQHREVKCSWDGHKCFQADSCFSFASIDLCANAFDGMKCTWYGPLNQCVDIVQANQLDRECDVRASEYLVFLSVLLLILYI